jgi:hypothetical protein
VAKAVKTETIALQRNLHGPQVWSTVRRTTAAAFKKALLAE